MPTNSAFTSVLSECLTEKEMRGVALKLVADAQADDARVRLPARKELFNRILGKDPIDLEAEDREAAMKLSDQELLDLFQKQVMDQKH